MQKVRQFNPVNAYGALAMGLVAFGFAPILVRFAPHTSPIVLTAYRTVFAVLFLLPYWWIKKAPASTALFNKENVKMALAGVSLGLHFTCWVASLYYTSVASSSVLVTMHPIFVILVERLWFKRSFAWTAWLGVVLAFGGSVLLGISDSQVAQAYPDALFGNFLAFSAAVIFVVYLFIGQQVRQKKGWVDYVFPVYTWAAVTCVILAIIAGENLLTFPTAGVWAGLGLAIGPQIVGHGSMNYVVKFVSPTLLSTLVLVEPLLASVLAFFIFGELPPILSIVAMVIILSGIGLTWRKKNKFAT